VIRKKNEVWVEKEISKAQRMGWGIFGLRWGLPLGNCKFKGNINAPRKKRFHKTIEKKKRQSGKPRAFDATCLHNCKTGPVQEIFKVRINRRAK